MAETLNTNIQLVLLSTLENIAAPNQTDDVTTLNVNQVYASGVGTNKANQKFSSNRTLAVSGAENINLYNFGGALDGVGQALALLNVKVFAVQNLNPLEGNYITIAPSGSNPWTSFFSGSEIIKGGGVFLAMAPGPSGWAVGSASNNTINVATTNAASAAYNIIVIGSTS